MIKYKKYIIFILMVSGLVIAFSFYIFKYIENGKCLNTIDKEELFTSYKDYIENGEVNISSRKIIKRKEKYEVFIGKNQKEIENGYYDIYISLNEDIANIYINKLFKDYDGKIYDRNYLEEFINYMDYIFNMNLSENDKKDLIYKIENYYKKLRKIDEKIDYNLEDNIYIYKFNIEFKVDDNMLKIILSKR